MNIGFRYYLANHMAANRSIMPLMLPSMPVARYPNCCYVIIPGVYLRRTTYAMILKMMLLWRCSDVAGVTWNSAQPRWRGRRFCCRLYFYARLSFFKPRLCWTNRMEAGPLLRRNRLTYLIGGCSTGHVERWTAGGTSESHVEPGSSTLNQTEQNVLMQGQRAELVRARFYVEHPQLRHHKQETGSGYLGALRRAAVTGNNI